MGAVEEPKVDDVDDEEEEEVQEHLKDAVEGTLRLKRLLSEDSQDGGGDTKKRRRAQDISRCGPEQAAKIQHLMAKWDALDDAVMKHVLEGLSLEEVENLDSSGFVPDKWNFQKSPADLTSKHAAECRERKTLGGGALDSLATFRFKWKLNQEQDSLLRNLSHKDLRYVLMHYDGERDLKELVEEAKKELPLDGTAEGCIPEAPGVQAVGRFYRLELIDPTADSAVFGDANLSFALNLAKHRTALGHVGRVIATTFESLQVLRERYKEIDTTIGTLWEHHAECYHEVDCTQIATNPSFKGLEGSLGAVYYNFPHAGSVGGFFDGHPMVNWRHENLMRLFFRALRHFVKPGGIVKVASNMGAVGVRFSYITGGALENEFDHVETVPFLQWNLHRYGRSYGDRRDAYRRPDQGEGYNVQRADRDMVYTFKYNPSGKTLGPQGIRLPPTLATLEECPDGPFTSTSGDARKMLAKQLHTRFMKECSGQHVG